MSKPFAPVNGGIVGLRRKFSPSRNARSADLEREIAVAQVACHAFLERRGAHCGNPEQGHREQHHHRDDQRSAALRAGLREAKDVFVGSWQSVPKRIRGYEHLAHAPVVDGIENGFVDNVGIFVDVGAVFVGRTRHQSDAHRGDLIPVRDVVRGDVRIDGAIQRGIDAVTHLHRFRRLDELFGNERGGRRRSVYLQASLEECRRAAARACADIEHPGLAADELGPGRVLLVGIPARLWLPGVAGCDVPELDAPRRVGNARDLKDRRLLTIRHDGDVAARVVVDGLRLR